MSMLTIGEIAPDFRLSDQDGNVQQLSEFQGKSVILYFYSDDDSPLTIRHACTFRDEFPQILNSDAMVLAIAEGEHLDLAVKYQLPFPVLSDRNGLIAGIYGALKQTRSRGSIQESVQRSIFLISPEGIVQRVWARIDGDGHATEALASLYADVRSERAATKAQEGRQGLKRTRPRREALKRSANKGDLAKRAEKKQMGSAKGRISRLKGKLGNNRGSGWKKAQPKRTSGKAKVLSRAAARKS